MTGALLALPGNERMASALARELGRNLMALEVHRFPDGETSLRVVGAAGKFDRIPGIAGCDVAIVCTLDHADEKIIALLFAADLARDLGAVRVGLVAPYLAYMRQDMRFNPGESVTARYFSRLLSASFDWLVTADPHLHRIASLDGVYTIPSLAVQSAAAIGTWIRAHVQHPGLIGPDAESRQWVGEVARHAGAPFLVLEKTRHGDQQVEVSVPDAPWLPGCTPVIVDDIASTAHTLIAAVRALKDACKAAPQCVVVHALFAGDAFGDLRAAGVAHIASCDTVPHASNAISLVPELADAVRRVCAMPPR